jgi:hypothetical protein
MHSKGTFFPNIMLMFFSRMNDASVKGFPAHEFANQFVAGIKCQIGRVHLRFPLWLGHTVAARIRINLAIRRMGTTAKVKR